VDGVARRAYDDPALAEVDKHELIGPTEHAAHDRVRYFCVPPPAARRSSATRMVAATAATIPAITTLTLVRLTIEGPYQ
jgi:hypothetical protein